MSSSTDARAVVWNAVRKGSLQCTSIAADNDSDAGSVISDSDSESDIEPSTLMAHIVENTAKLNDLRPSWTINPYEFDDSYCVVDPPSASKITYKVMHPLHYRHNQIGTGITLEDFETLATLLGAPDNWSDLLEGIENDDKIYDHLYLFMDWTGFEHTAEGLFSLLVNSIAENLNRTVHLAGHLSFAVAGLLVNTALITTGYTDNCWSTSGAACVDPHIILISEMKTSRTWRSNSKWYRSSRGLQARAALYASSAPTLLLCSTQFKLFLPPTIDNLNGWTYPPENSLAAPGFLLPVLALIILGKALPKQPVVRRPLQRKVFTPVR